MKKILSLFTMLVLLFSAVSCSKDDIGIEDPNKGQTTETVDEQQVAQTNIVVAAANSKAMVESITQSGSNYVVTFSDGSKAEITLKTKGSANAVYVKSIVITDDQVTFTLTNGQVLILPQLYAMTVVFDNADLTVMGPNDSREVHYKVTSNFDDIKVEVNPSEGIQAEVIADKPSQEGVIKITTGNEVPEGSNVIVFISNPGKTISQKIALEGAGLVVYNNSVKEVDSGGGTVRLEYLTNIDNELVIPEEYKDWISPANTRSLEYAYTDIMVEPNNMFNREAKVTLRGIDYDMEIEYTIVQAGALGEEDTSIEMTFDPSDLRIMDANSEMTVAYNVVSKVPSVTVEATSSEGLSATVEPDANDARKGVIRIVSGSSIPENSYIALVASNGFEAVTKRIELEESGLKVYDNSLKEIDDNGGTLRLEFLTNVDCIIRTDCDWIKASNTRSIEYAYLDIEVLPNEGAERSGVVTVYGINNNVSLEYTVHQAAMTAPDLDKATIPANEIWYVTTDGNPIEIVEYMAHFDVSLKSNTYSKGFGIIRLESPVSVINDNSGIFSYPTLKEVYLPDGIKEIGNSVFYQSPIEKLKLPSSLEKVGTYGVLNAPNIKEFTGANTYDNGRMVILNNILVGLVTKGVKEIVIPGEVKVIQDYLSSDRGDVETLVMEEGVEHIGDMAFNNWEDLKTVTFPNSLKTAERYAFIHCPSLTGFYGNPRFIRDNNRVFVDPSYGNLICRVAAADLESYTIPSDLNMVENYSFSNYKNLKSVTFHGDITYVGSDAFQNCTGLEAVYGPITGEDNYSIVIGDELSFIAVKSKLPKEYRVPDNVTKIGMSAFNECPGLESITMGDQVTSIGDYAFSYCPNLKTVTLSGRTNIMGTIYGANPFRGCENLQSIYLRAQVPPGFRGLYWEELQGDVIIYVPRSSVELYKKHNVWGAYDNIKGYDYTDLPTLDYYYSTDFSKDGEVITLQKATEGNGIDIVIMGDGYSDRQIANGTYLNDMKYMYENLFTIEPYTTYKYLFNVYAVNAVSYTEGYEIGNTVFGCYFGDLTYVAGDNEMVMNYTLKAIDESRMNEAMMVVVLNSNAYAGTCHMFQSEIETDYASGPSISYFPKGGDEETFASTLHHETLGHGFSKLADEYYYDFVEEMSEYDASLYKNDQLTIGWWKNVDFTPDPEKVLWAKFLKDPRYASEGLGVFEGGLVCPKGVWRPTETSIMVYNVGEFNAPSREAIYYRINKLAYGNSWQYDYEKFVEQDLKRNRPTGTRSAGFNEMSKLHAPVVVNKTWKDVVKGK